MGSNKVLVLNMDYTFLGVCDWQSAVCAWYSGKAIVEAEYEREVHSAYMTVKVPAVIRLKKFVHVFYERITYVSYNKRNVHLRDNYICQYCSVKCDHKNTTIDHVVPESKGGTDTWTNCVTACKSCNRDKDDRPLWETGMKLIRQPSRPKGFREIVRVKLGEIHDLWLPYLKE